MRCARPRPHFILVAAAAIGVYAMSLGTQGFVRDDRWLIAGNRLIHQGLGAVPRILGSGYVEMVMGAQAPIQEYRPLLTLTYLAHFLTTGDSGWPMHAANVLLHAAACCLLLAALRRRMEPFAALAGALLFAVMPVHAEAVCYITSRSELLVAVCLLGAWLLLEGEASVSLAGGCALYGAALLCKEHAILFPLFLAGADWAFHGKAPWHPDRRAAQAALLSCAGSYLGLRSLVLSRMLHGGVPYFSDRIVALLTFSRFAFGHYLWPSVMGVGLCSDFSRPMIPDARPAVWTAWLPLVAWISLGLAAARALARRQDWGFWVIGPCLFLLPTCHVLFPLDTLGAERFLYLPSLGLAALFGMALGRLKRSRPSAAAAALLFCLFAYAGLAVARNRVWLSEPAYYEAAVSCNPLSAKSRAALGAVRVERGEVARGESDLWAAAALDSRLPQSYYNLARLAWDRGDLSRAEQLARRAVSLDDSASDAKVLLALCLERGGRLDDSARLLRGVLTAMPWHAEALFNLGRLELLRGRAAEAKDLLSRYAQLAPDDPDAAKALALAEGKSRP